LPNKRRILKTEPEFVVGAAFLVAFVLFSALQVVLRYVFRFSFPWVEELLGILLVWMTFIGAAGLAKKRLHIHVELIEEFLPAKWIRLLDIVYNIITVAYLALIAYGGLQLWDRLRLQRTPAMRMPLRYVALVVPVTAALMLFYYGRHVIHDIKNGKRDEA
jgi:TRAP-type transport system small permease protein